MDLVSFFSQTNTFKGNFIQVGFRKGLDTKSIFNAMNEGTLTKRESFIFDSFTGASSGRLGQAMDMRFSLTNPNKKVSVIKGDLQNTLPSSYDSSKIAYMLIDLDSYSTVLHSLLSLHKHLVRDGLVFVTKYGLDEQVTKAVDDFILSNKLSHQVFTLGESTYIKNKVAPVEFTPTRVGKSDRAPEEGIKVQRPEPVKPFKDRYIKKQIPEFKPTPVVKEGLQVIDKKVSK